MTIDLTEAERNMLVVLLIEQESKYPDQLYIQRGRALKERLKRLKLAGQAVQDPR